jgi:hypothetical protein
MATDTHCPSCHSSVARATAAAPGEFAKDDNVFLKMLPVFGGAAGGLLAGAIKAADASTQPSARQPQFFTPATAAGSGRPSVGKLLIGLVFVFGGGLFTYIAGLEAWNTWNVSRRPATEVTEAELGRPDFAKSAPDWIHYTFADSKPTPVVVKRKRLTGSGEADACCLLVHLDNKWLVAMVPPGFQGNELTGYVVPFDPTASRPMLEQIMKAEPKLNAILPFEFNAVEGSVGDQRLRNMGAALLGCFGLVGVLLGVYLIPFRAGRAAKIDDRIGRVVQPAAENMQPPR